jgi:ribosomal protein L22
MADEKKTTPKDEAKKPAARKPAAKKPAAKKAAADKPAAKKPAARKPSAKKETGTAKKDEGAKRAAAKGETATKPKAETAAESTSKAAQPEAKSRSTKRGGTTTAKKPAAKKAAAPEADQRPVVNARARFVRVAPRKARLVADQVRGLPVDAAQTLLRFSPRSAAQDIAKLIASAAANAENNHDLIADELVVKDISVDEGPTLKRYRPRALGRATRINKRTSHIKVALTPEDDS